MRSEQVYFEEHYRPLSGSLRAGNEPELLLPDAVTDRSIVLIHGLTDSPHFMRAIGRRFRQEGFHVVLPLLPGHGLRSPARAMGQVTLEDWLKEVDFVLDIAHGLGRIVSIGGLSTGGALSLYRAATQPGSVTGAVYLFSAALDIGDVKEFALRQDRVAKMLAIADEKKRLAFDFNQDIKSLLDRQSKADSPEFGIGDNPFRYSEMFYNGATQLALLLRRIADRYEGRPRYGDISQPVFIAHSEADETAKIGELELLHAGLTASSRATFFRRIPTSVRTHSGESVPHASLVLEEDITARDEEGQIRVLEEANPVFDDMMGQALAFADRHVR